MLEDTNSLDGAQLIALIEPGNMYSAAAIGVITIFIVFIYPISGLVPGDYRVTDEALLAETT